MTDINSIECFMIKDYSFLPFFTVGDILVVNTTSEIKDGDCLLLNFGGHYNLRRVFRRESGFLLVSGEFETEFITDISPYVVGIVQKFTMPLENVERKDFKRFPALDKMPQGIVV